MKNRTQSKETFVFSFRGSFPNLGAFKGASSSRGGPPHVQPGGARSKKPGLKSSGGATRPLVNGGTNLSAQLGQAVKIREKD